MKRKSIYLTCGWQDFAYISNNMGSNWQKSTKFGYADYIMIDDEVTWLSGVSQKFSLDGGNTWTTTTEKNSSSVNNDDGLTGTFAIGKKAWGVATNGGVFIFE